MNRTRAMKDFALDRCYHAVGLATAEPYVEFARILTVARPSACNAPISHAAGSDTFTYPKCYPNPPGRVFAQHTSLPVSTAGAGCTHPVPLRPLVPLIRGMVEVNP